MKTPKHLAISIVREAEIKHKSGVITRSLACQALRSASVEKIDNNTNHIK